MPVSTRARKLKKVPAKKPVRRKTLARKIQKKVTKGMVRGAANTSPVIGQVTHYYDHIGVAVVRLSAPVHVGQVVQMGQGAGAFLQTVASLHVRHEPVIGARAGEEVGLKVDSAVRPGMLVLHFPPAL